MEGNFSSAEVEVDVEVGCTNEDVFDRKNNDENWSLRSEENKGAV